MTEPISQDQEPISPTVKVLTTQDGRRWLKYSGPRDIVRYFLHIEGARIYDSGQTLVAPLCRDNVLALEILGQLQEPDRDYAGVARELLWPSEKSLALYPPTVPGAPEPRWHQEATFGSCMDAFVAGRKGFGVFNCLGSGKTRTAIDLMRHFVPARALVIGVKVTLEQWAEELQRAWPEAEAHVLHQVSKKATLEERREKLYSLRQAEAAPGPPYVVLVNWEALADLEKDLKKFPKWDAIVADEASKLLGRTTKMARAAKSLAWKHAWYSFALTGTPIRRGVEDLLALFQFVDTQVFGSSIANFREQYCNEAFGGIGNLTYVPKPEKVVDLVRKVYSAGFRVSRAAVDLPEPERRVVRLQPSQEQKEALERIDKSLTSDVSNVLARMVRQQQITAGFEIYSGHDFGLENDGPFVPRYLDDPKAGWLEDYLNDLMSGEDSHTIVWTRFIPEIEAVYERLASAFPGAVAQIDGSVPDRKRQVIRRRFNDRRDELRILVMNIQTGALGLDLPATDVEIYHSDTFDFVCRTQADGRGTRLGRIKPCLLIDLVLEGTIDEDIQQNRAGKKLWSDLLTGQGYIKQKQPNTQ